MLGDLLGEFEWSTLDSCNSVNTSRIVTNDMSMESLSNFATDDTRSVSIEPILMKSCRSEKGAPKGHLGKKGLKKESKRGDNYLVEV